MLRSWLTGAALLFSLPALADPAATVHGMRAAWKKTRDYSAELHVRQRVNGTLYKEQITLFKFRAPAEIYAKRLNEPNQNAEALYRGPKWNSGKMLANKGSFPNLTLSLDPYSGLAMDGQNHPMPRSHLGVFIERITSDLKAAEAEGIAAVASPGTGSVDGQSCEKISFSTNPKAGSAYTPKKGDSWRSIAKAKNADPLALRLANPGKKPDDPSAELFIPVYYAAKWDLCVDAKSGLPLSFVSYDATGNILDSYELHDLAVNSGLSDADFDPENKSYHF